MTVTTAIGVAETAETEAPEVKAEVVVWVHGDHLSAANPALTEYPDAPAVFVFDETFLREEGLAFHRLFFIYESVTEIFAARPAGSCSLRRGNVTEEVVSFARQHGMHRIVTTETIGDRFAEYVQEMESAGMIVTAVPVPSLVAYEGKRVPKRFSVWWREIEAEALRP